MLEFRCEDVGVTCRGRVKADTKEELLQKVAHHAAKKHGVPKLNQTLINYAVAKTRGAEEAPQVQA